MRDYGWDMPDIRADYWYHDPDSWEWYDCTEDEDRTPDNVGDDAFGEYGVSGRIQVRIRRVWRSAYDPDGYEMEPTYDCKFDVVVDGATECTFSSESKAENYIAAEYPAAEFDNDMYYERRAAASGRPY
tara:strand:+ start:443 stop:829 length:387 start_codon:yes stop_codon:yes gene_type:complete